MGSDGGGPPLNLHLQQLRYLRTVAQLGNLGRAAAALHVSQPALSQAIAELERRLGIGLFERSGRGRRPTVAGQAVIAFAEAVLGQATALEQTLAALRGGASGPLTVGMIDAAGLYVLPEVVRQFRSRYPGVELRLAVATSGELLQRLRDFSLDLAFVVGPVADADLAATEVLREPLYIYRPEGDDSLSGAAHWVLYPEGSRTRGIIDRAFAALGLQPTIALESGNPQVLRQMVTLGLGWSVLPPAIAEESDHHGGLLRGALLAERPLSAVRRRHSGHDPRIEAFLTLVAGFRGAEQSPAL